MASERPAGDHCPLSAGGRPRRPHTASRAHQAPSPAAPCGPAARQARPSSWRSTLCQKRPFGAASAGCGHRGRRWGPRGTQLGGSQVRHELEFLLPFPLLAWEGGGGRGRRAGWASTRAQPGSLPPAPGLSWLGLLLPDGVRVVRAAGSACARVRVRESACVFQIQKKQQRRRGDAQLREAGRARSVPVPSALAPRGPGRGRGAGPAAEGEMDACHGKQRAGRLPCASGRTGPVSQTKPAANRWQPVQGRQQPLGQGAVEDSAGRRRTQAAAQVTGACGSPGTGPALGLGTGRVAGPLTATAASNGGPGPPGSRPARGTLSNLLPQVLFRAQETICPPGPCWFRCSGQESSGWLAGDLSPHKGGRPGRLGCAA